MYFQDETHIKNEQHRKGITFVYYKELKRKKKSEKNKNNYMKNRDKYKSKKVTEYSKTKAATIKINQRKAQ